MDVNYKRVTPYNTKIKPRKPLPLFTFAVWLLSKISLIGTKYKIEKIDMDGIQPPYLLLSNHMYFVDFNLCYIATFPHAINNVATIDGYYRRPHIMELLGCICKRKFTNDLSLIKAIRYCMREYDDIVCMYPEARYSPIGTTAILPDSLGKMVKMFKVPVVALVHHGNYLRSPFWDHNHTRKVPLYTTMTGILTAEQIEQASVDEINDIIRKALYYNEYEWQKNNNIQIADPQRAKNLHKVLYQCTQCHTEHKMESDGSVIWCNHCKAKWQMDEFGELHMEDGETRFTHIPDWFEWERSEVRRQIEEGTYCFEDWVDVYSLPHAKSFIHLGNAKLTHNEKGLKLEGAYRGKPYCITRSAKSMYGIHIEYDYVYVKPFDCIDISTENDSYYCYPTKQNVVTKVSFAVEELYKIYEEQRKENKDREQ